MLKVVIVDDEIGQCIGMENIMHSLFPELEIKYFTEAEAALAYMQKEKVKIVISDICMPDIDGLEFAKQVKKTDKQVEVILLTGYAEFEYAQKAIRLGVFDYLLKPLDPDRLLEVMNTILKNIQEDNSFSRQVVKAESQNILRPKKDKYEKLESEFKNYINLHYKEDIALEEISAYLMLTPAYCSALIKKLTGMTFLQNLICVRVEKAKELLKNTHLQVNQIAIEVGYNDVKYFNRVFKNEVEMTPMQYRKKVCKRKEI